MDDISKRYLEEQKKNFNNDMWWGKTPKELAEDVNKTKKGYWHLEHDNNPDYYNILYGDIVKNKEYWKGKSCFDFGFGFGGNIKNLYKIAEWNKLYGCDIASKFIDFGNEYLKALNLDVSKIKLFETNGYDLSFMKNESVDFCTSIIVLQHIALHQIRFNLLKEFHRILKKDGVLSFQMNKGSGIDYYSTIVSPQSRPNCKVTHESQVINDLIKIGFSEDKISFVWLEHPMNPTGKLWLYIKAIK